ncbi:hypothetical protein ACWCQW_10250 [Streptomyces mirabilis]
MYARSALITVAILAATLTACSSDKPDTQRHYASAQAIADALQKAGFTVSMLHKSADAGYISQVGGTAYDFTVTDKTGQPAPGDGGINMFPNADALKSWTGISKSFGGIAVTGDTWAVSLPTTSKSARADSQRLAPKIAKELSGTVQR